MSRPVIALILFPVLAVLINWPYLNAGFSLDDILIYNAFQEDPLNFSRWGGVWSGKSFHHFDNLWWRDADTVASFWRPIPSLILEASFRIFDRNAVPLHLLSILLHGFVSTALYFLVRRLANSHMLALLAALFFVAGEDHGLTVGWIATFTDLLCVQFIILTILAHIDWLQRRRILSLVGSLLSLIFAMGCKETAVIAPVAIVLLTLFMPTGSEHGESGWSEFRKQTGNVVRDRLSWLPALLVLITYLIVYKLWNLGVMNNLLYTDPISDPGKYFANLALYLPTFWLATFSSIPIWPTILWPVLYVTYALLGLVIFLAWLAALWQFRTRALVQWAFALYLVSLLPQVCVDASERGLYFPMIPACILLASVTLTIGPLARRMDRPLNIKSRWTSFVGWLAIVGILGLGALQAISSPLGTAAFLRSPAREMSTAQPYIEQEQPEHVIILNASGMWLSLYTQDYVEYLSGQKHNVWLLSAAYGDFSLERDRDASFVIRTDRVGWLSSFIARVIRTEPVFEPGHRHERELFTAIVEDVTKDGSDVLSVRFDFNRPLDDPGLLFLRWNGEAFEPMDIASLDVGETVELADTSDFLETS